MRSSRIIARSCGYCGLYVLVFSTFQIDVSSSSKEDRTKIHEAVKKAFGDGIVGSTVNIDDKKLMRFEKFRRGGKLLR